MKSREQRVCPLGTQSFRARLWETMPTRARGWGRLRVLNRLTSVLFEPRAGFQVPNWIRPILIEAGVGTYQCPTQARVGMVNRTIATVLTRTIATVPVRTVVTILYVSSQRFSPTGSNSASLHYFQHTETENRRSILTRFESLLSSHRNFSFPSFSYSEYSSILRQTFSCNLSSFKV